MRLRIWCLREAEREEQRGIKCELTSLWALLDESGSSVWIEWIFLLYPMFCINCSEVIKVIAIWVRKAGPASLDRDGRRRRSGHAWVSEWTGLQVDWPRAHSSSFSEQLALQSQSRWYRSAPPFHFHPASEESVRISNTSISYVMNTNMTNRRLTVMLWQTSLEK